MQRLLLLAATMISASAGFGQTIIHVPGDQPTIQAGINAASPGDEVVVAPGTYTGDGNRDLDFGGKAITVRSTDPDWPDVVSATVIDCQGTEAEPHRGFRFHSGEGPGSVVSGLTITNGYGPEEQCEFLRSYGGGIFCRNSSSPSITNCIIIDNEAVGGGGIFLFDRCNPAITSCTIRSNTAGIGGGIAMIGHSQPTISDCKISDNRASTERGGISSGAGSSPIIVNCVIAGNSTSGWGGGIGISGGSAAHIINCMITDNTAGTVGGGVFASQWQSPLIRHCTIAGNTAADEGGGIYLIYGCYAPMNNCIVRGNNAPVGGQIALGEHSGSSWLSIDYSNVAVSGVNENPNTDVIWGDGNIDIAPLFVDPDGDDDDPATWEDNDYHLSASSPCIDTGDPAFVPGPDETDIDGQPRVLHGRVDMGADEFGWFADFDFDGDVDLTDFTRFQYCFNGPNRAPLWPDCEDTDLDDDTDVDLADFGLFASCFNGPNRPPACE